MKVAVYAKDKEFRTVLFSGRTIETLFSRAIKIKSDGMLRLFRLLGDGDNGLEVNVRSDSPDHLQCIIERKKKNISFQFSGLKIGCKQKQHVGSDIFTGKFTSSPWEVTVKKLEDQN